MRRIVSVAILLATLGFSTAAAIANVPRYLDFAKQYFANNYGYNGVLTVTEQKYLDDLQKQDLSSMSGYAVERNLINKAYDDLAFVNSSVIISDPFTMFMSNRMAFANVIMPQLAFIQDSGYSLASMQLFQSIKDAILVADSFDVQCTVWTFLSTRGLLDRVSNLYLVISTRTAMWLLSPSQFVSLNPGADRSFLQIASEEYLNATVFFQSHLTTINHYEEQWQSVRFGLTIFEIPRPTLTVQDQCISNEMVSYWPMNDGGAANVRDLGLSKSNGSLVQGVDWQLDSGSYFLLFDGKTGFVQVPQSRYFDFSNSSHPFTISVWVKPAGTDLQAPASILGNGACGTAGYRLRLDKAGLSFFLVDSAGEGLGTVSTSFNSNSDSWRHIVAVNDGARLLLYVDGVLQASRTVAAGTISSEASYLTIGYDFSKESNGCGQEYFGGSIKDVKIYNRAFATLDIAIA
jgi:hypothetical protein